MGGRSRLALASSHLGQAYCCARETKTQADAAKVLKMDEARPGREQASQPTALRRCG
jgi:hypothetical protein